MLRFELHNYPEVKQLEISKSVLLVFFFIIIFISTSRNVNAQMHQSLLGWEDETKMMILNRYQSDGGIFYDRGLFRFTTHRFTHQHDLDLLSYTFTPVDHYSWYYNETNSFRTYMGSYNLGQFLHGAEIRNYIPLTDKLTFPLRLHKRYDMRADRSLAILAINYEIRDNHFIGASHTLNETKPDMDVTFYYRYRDLSSGGFQVEFSPLDWANNAAYKLGQRRGTETPELRDYEKKPYMFSFKANTPILEYFRIEAVGGIQTPLTAVAVSMPEEFPEEFFRDRDVTRYGGILAEFAHPYVSLGTSFRHTYTKFSRRNASNIFTEPVDYGNRQIQNSFGIFSGFSYRKFYTQNWVWRNYNLDVQRDEYETRMEHGIKVYPFDFREFRWQTQFRIGYNQNTKGLTASVEWTSDHRRPTENFIIRDELESRGLPYRTFYNGTLSLKDERLALQFGYRFTGKTYFLLGFSFDIDGDKMGSYWDRVERENGAWFDGGYGRFVIHWN